MKLPTSNLKGRDLAYARFITRARREELAGRSVLGVWWTVTLSCWLLTGRLAWNGVARRFGGGSRQAKRSVLRDVPEAALRERDVPVVNAATLETFESLLRGDRSRPGASGTQLHWPPSDLGSMSLDSLTASEDVQTLGPLADPNNPQVGELVGPGGRYEILKLLGSGGQGDVFKARDTQDQDQLVAIKFYRRRSTGSIDVETARRELRAMEEAAYPGLVRAKNIEQHQSYYFVVMELVEGTNLSEMLESLTTPSSPAVPTKGPRVFSAEACCWILEQLEAPLNHIHRLGLCHQDLKPANLIVRDLDPRGRTGFEAASLKILDFGCASSFDVKDGRASGEGPIGTPHYMPVNTFQSHDASPERDVYSVAATLFELRTGTRLAIPQSWAGMRSRGALERCRANRQRQIADFIKAQRRGSRADRRLAKAIVRGLNETPSMRPASIGHLLYLATGGRAGVAPSWRPSRRKLICASAIALCMLTAGAASVINLDEQAVLMDGTSWERNVTQAEAIASPTASNPFPAARRSFRVRYANDLPGTLTAGLLGSATSASVDRIDGDIFEVSVDLPDQGRQEIRVRHGDRVIFSRAVLVDTGIRRPTSIAYDGARTLTPGETIEFDLAFDEAVSIDVAWRSSPTETFFSSGPTPSIHHHVVTDSSPNFMNKGQILASGALIVHATDAYGNERIVRPDSFIRFQQQFGSDALSAKN
ncbi:MAG: serine/threonine-protein kinase [Planctomycetota bacterium]